MFSSIVIVAITAIIAFVFGVALGLTVHAEDGTRLIAAKKELVDLRSALAAKESEVNQVKHMHEKTVDIAYSVVLDYEAVFDKMTLQNQSHRSAVILPFKEKRGKRKDSDFP